jgi:AraC-like DNA-binding protein
MEKIHKPEWSRYYHLDGLGSTGALHGHFVTHRYPRHVHDYFVVGLVEAGAEYCFYRGTTRVISAGQTFVINPDEPHTGEAAAPEGYVCRNLYFDGAILARIFDDFDRRAKVSFFTNAVLNDPSLTLLLSRFHGCLIASASKIERQSYLFEALAYLTARHGDSQITGRRVGRERLAVKRAREYIETHFSNDVSLTDLASVASLSPYYFARVFESEIGVPPHAYLEGVRIRRARERLAKGASIVSTALSVGYADQSHLTRRFKRYVGVTPGQYIRGNKIRQDGDCAHAQTPIYAESARQVGVF